MDDLGSGDIGGTLAAVKSAFGIFREAIGLARDVQSALPEGEKRTAIEESLLKAEKASQIAEAQIAKSLGYELCQCTFPPQIKLSIGFVSGTGIDRLQCPNCKRIWPPEDLKRQERPKTSYF